MMEFNSFYVSLFCSDSSLARQMLFCSCVSMGPLSLRLFPSVSDLILRGIAAWMSGNLLIQVFVSDLSQP
jgi:hypothetical protein